MSEETNSKQVEHKTKVYRWLFYFSSFALIMSFLIPVLIFPGKVLLPLQLLNALTVALVVGIHSLAVNLLGLYFDKERRVLYLIIIAALSLWMLCSYLMNM